MGKKNFKIVSNDNMDIDEETTSPSPIKAVKTLSSLIE